jgi:hypothetical protein
VSGGLLHAAAIVLGLLALGGAGRVVVGDPEEAWKRASIVRVQLVVLVALFAVVFLVPVTSAQVIDVVRAWGEGSAQSGLFTAASVAFAGALLLGAVCRASSIRLLSAVPGETHWRPTWLIFAVLAGVLVACAVLGAYLGALMAAIALAIMGVTQWAESPAAEAGWEDAQTRARRLAGTLSVVPLAIVVAALAGATVDSWLLPSRGAAADGALIALTFVAAAVLAALAAISQRPSFGWTLLRGLPWLAAPIGLAVGLVTVVVVLAVPGRFEVLATIPLLAFAAMLAFRCFAQGGGPELWGALGVVLAVVGGVYADPIALPRALGAFGIALIGTTGLLLGLHAIAVVGARRAWKAEPPLLPKRVPVGSLLAIWLVAAFLWPAIGAHQVRTVAGGAAAPLLSTTTTGWLDARLKALGGKPPYIPMLLVGASGGGARAAYWTDLVMDCVLGIEGPKKDTRECEVAPTARKRGSALFLTSSVSGGSIGVYHLVTHLAIAEAGEDWVDATAGPEVLSPVTGWGLFHDMPAFMTGLDRSPPECESDVSCRRNADRALVQEAAISGFPRGGIVPPKTQRLLAPALPVTVFNARWTAPTAAS